MGYDPDVALPLAVLAFDGTAKLDVGIFLRSAADSLAIGQRLFLLAGILAVFPLVVPPMGAGTLPADMAPIGKVGPPMGNVGPPAGKIGLVRGTAFLAATFLAGFARGVLAIQQSES
jgi:hypothetical protein